MFANAEQYRAAVREALKELPAGEFLLIRAKGSEVTFEAPRKVAAQCIAEGAHSLATAEDMELHKQQLEARRAQHEIDEKRRADSAGFRVIVNNVPVPSADVVVEKNKKSKD